MQALGLLHALKPLQRALRTMVLSETRHVAGLTLILVLREGLWLGEYLGPLEPGGRTK